jgi:adenosine deaminase
MAVSDFIRTLPRAELHLHIEGSLEPEMMLALAARNGIESPYPSIEEARAAYAFHSLQEFLDLYYVGMSVLQRTDDYRDLTAAYLARAAADSVIRAEIFFDPQGHTARGIPCPRSSTALPVPCSLANRHWGCPRD